MGLLIHSTKYGFEKQMLNDLCNANLIVWDFDGVIKDSVSVKGLAFVDALGITDSDLASKIIDHHTANAGMDRKTKIHRYMELVDKPTDEASVNDALLKFAQITEEKVCNSKWVPGIQNYLKQHQQSQKHIIASATPKDEMKRITSRLELSCYFDQIYGSPISKFDAAVDAMKRLKISRRHTILIGDTALDLDTAHRLGIKFCLRRTSYNSHIRLPHGFIEVHNFL